VTSVTADLVNTAARRVLLDALDALDEHRDAVILIGAQAVYLQTGDPELDLSVAPYTADADLSIDPRVIGGDPRIVDAMLAAGFVLKVKAGGGTEPGTWITSVQIAGQPVTVPVDLLIPESLAIARGNSRRDARLPEHGNQAARWTAGIEATVIDNTSMQIRSFDPDTDPRVATVRVAGPASLLIAKAHKLAERVADSAAGHEQRLKPKDAGDVIRLMRSPTSPARIGRQLAALAADPTCTASVTAGVGHLQLLFGRAASPGIELAVTALAGAMEEATVRALANGYVTAMVEAYEGAS